MDIRFLESLIAVVDAGSIAGAARLQGLTPAAISQRIQALERYLDCELLLRSAHAARPTENCLNLIPRARKLVKEAEALKGDIDLSGLSGSLRLGAISTALTGILPPVLHKLAKKAPGIKPYITPGTSQMLYDELRSDNLDAAIMVAPSFEAPKSLDFQILREEPLLLLSKDNTSRSIEELLSTEPYICYDSKSWGGRIAAQYIVDNRLSPEVLFELDALETIQILVEKGLGVSLVPLWQEMASRSNGLTFHQIEDPRYIRKIVLVTGKQPRQPKIIETLKNACCA